MATEDKRLAEPASFDMTDKLSLELLDRMPTPVVVLTREGNVHFLNRAMENLTEYSLSEAVGKNFISTFIPDRDQTKEREIIENLVWLQQPLSHKTVIRTKSGAEEIHGWSAACFVDPLGRSTLIALFGHHEHGSPAVEEYLKSSGVLMEAALAGLDTEVVMLNRHWKIVHLSDALRRTFPEAAGKTCYEAMAKRQSLCEQCPATSMCESEREVWENARQSLPNRIELRNTQCPWAAGTGAARMAATPVVDCTGDVIGTAILMADGGGRPIDERLKIAEESLRSLLSHSLDGIMFVNPATDTILDANGRACNMLGEEKAALVGTKATDIFMPDSQEKYVKLLGQTLLKNGDHFQMMASVGKLRSGALHVQVLAIMVDTNGSRRLHLLLRDVSKEHHVQGQLRSQLSLLQNVNDAIISIDVNQTVLFMNKKAESVYGLKAEEAICRPLYDVIRYEFISLGQEEEARTQLQQNGFWRGEVIHHNKDGRPISIDSSVSMIYDDEGKPACLVTVNRDITARKESERKLKRRGDEMAALYEIGQALSRHLSLNDVLSVIHTQVSRLMNARNFYIALYDPAKDEVFFPVYVDELVRKDGTSRKAKKGYTEYVIHKGEPLLLSKQNEEEMVRDGYQGIGPQAVSWLGVPLNSGQKVIGMMAVQSYSKSDQYGEDDLRILSAIADQVAVAIENARMFERVRTSEEIYRNLIESMSDGYMLIQNGKISLVNQSLAECLSYSKDELVGRDVGSILSPESLDAVSALQSRPLEPGENWAASRLELISRQGHKTELDFNFRTLSYEGSPALVGICSRFVTAPVSEN